MTFAVSRQHVAQAAKTPAVMLSRAVAFAEADDQHLW